MLVSRIMSMLTALGTILLWGALVVFWSSLSNQTVFTLSVLSWFMVVSSFMFSRLALYFEDEMILEEQNRRKSINDDWLTLPVPDLYPQDEQPLLPSQEEIMRRRSRISNQNQESNRYVAR